MKENECPFCGGSILVNGFTTTHVDITEHHKSDCESFSRWPNNKSLEKAIKEVEDKEQKS